VSNSSFSFVLEQLEATEANLERLEALCKDIEGLIPSGISFEPVPPYEDNCRAAMELADCLPAIDRWGLNLEFLDLDDIAQTRLDAMEIGEPTAEIDLYRSIENPSRQLREYRFRFNRKRRNLTRDAIDKALDGFDEVIRRATLIVERMDQHEKIPDDILLGMRTHFYEIATLMGSSMARPARWSDLSRHLRFGLARDFQDIATLDWPPVKAHIRANLYAPDEPLPVKVTDLGELEPIKSSATIPTKLNWKNLNDEEFERLIFALISGEPGYENPEWSMKTRAADRGRDVAATRVTADGLSGTLRSRVVIQCKHWLKKSVAPDEIALLREQVKLWEPPRVDVLIIATSGRFTADAVVLVERQTQSDQALRIELWAESHLELLLAARPALIAEFGLR
jgi:hypothetical protein